MKMIQKCKPVLESVLWIHLKWIVIIWLILMASIVTETEPFQFEFMVWVVYVSVWLAEGLLLVVLSDG